MARAEWTTRGGRCAVCGKRGRIVFHHVVTRQHVERAGGDVWDFRNAMPLGAPIAQGGICRCHANHHAAFARIPLPLVPEAAREFAVELLGADRAAAYFARYYTVGHPR